MTVFGTWLLVLEAGGKARDQGEANDIDDEDPVEIDERKLGTKAACVWSVSECCRQPLGVTGREGRWWRKREWENNWLGAVW